MDRLDRVSRKYSLLINVDKTKVMASDGIACRIGLLAGFVSSRNAPERRSCSFFDHRNAVPVLFGI